MWKGPLMLKLLLTINNVHAFYFKNIFVFKIKWICLNWYYYDFSIFPQYRTYFWETVILETYENGISLISHLNKTSITYKLETWYLVKELINMNSTYTCMSRISWPFSECKMTKKLKHVQYICISVLNYASF